ncbi:MAG TPA: MFS transporter [Candidatus Omnitrophota bacterium]|nr:MFS transporter [Candidatus Omnitrophota bacterium]HPS37527.1 MFS transporter [Candidatus Omnitrophota bacterium]
MTKKQSWLSLAVVFGSVYFFSLNGLGSLPALAVNYLLKDKAGLTPEKMAYFQAVTLIAWVIKPFWGLISDLFPIFGSRRRSYLILTSVVAGAAWLVLAFLPDLGAASLLLMLMTLIYMAYAFQDVVTDGLMVESGQALDRTGQFQSIQWSAVYAAMIVTAFAGGYVAELAQKGAMSYRSIFAITAAFPALTAMIVFFMVREPAQAHLERAAETGLRDVFRHKGIWVLSAFLFLWNFSPSFGAPFFYYTVDTLKFSASFLGILQAVTSAGALVGSVFYGLLFAKFPVRKFLLIAVMAGVVSTLSYFIYFAPWLVHHASVLKTLALVMNFLLGTASAVIFLALLNLAARCSPQYAGGTVFALLMSFYNFGQMGSSAFGGFLFPRIGLEPLIFLSAGFSLLALFLIPYLPVPKTDPAEGLEGGRS